MLVSLNLKRQRRARRLEVTLHARLRAAGRGRVSQDSRSRAGPLRRRRALIASTCACPGPWQRWQSIPSGSGRNLGLEHPRTVLRTCLAGARDASERRRITVVTGHAARIDDASEVEMRRTCRTRGSSPSSRRVRRTSSPASERAAHQRCDERTFARDCPNRRRSAPRARAHSFPFRRSQSDGVADKTFRRARRSCSADPKACDGRGPAVVNSEPLTLENERAMPVRLYVRAISAWHEEQTAGSA